MLENRMRPISRSMSGQHPGRRSIDLRPLNAQTLQALREPSAAMQRTQHWLQGSVEPTGTTIIKIEGFPDALALINVHKRRCQEGYRFDCARNIQIVKDLETRARSRDLNSTITRLDQDNMSTDSVDTKETHTSYSVHKPPCNLHIEPE